INSSSSSSSTSITSSNDDDVDDSSNHIQIHHPKNHDEECHHVRQYQQLIHNCNVVVVDSSSPVSTTLSSDQQLQQQQQPSDQSSMSAVTDCDATVAPVASSGGGKCRNCRHALHSLQSSMHHSASDGVTCTKMTQSKSCPLKCVVQSQAKEECNNRQLMCKHCNKKQCPEVSKQQQNQQQQQKCGCNQNHNHKTQKQKKEKEKKKKLKHYNQNLHHSQCDMSQSHSSNVQSHLKATTAISKEYWLVPLQAVLIVTALVVLALYCYWFVLRPSWPPSTSTSTVHLSPALVRDSGDSSVVSVANGQRLSRSTWQQHTSARTTLSGGDGGGADDETRAAKLWSKFHAGDARQLHSLPATTTTTTLPIQQPSTLKTTSTTTTTSSQQVPDTKQMSSHTTINGDNVSKQIDHDSLVESNETNHTAINNKSLLKQSLSDRLSSLNKLTPTRPSDNNDNHNFMLEHTSATLNRWPLPALQLLRMLTPSVTHGTQTTGLVSQSKARNQSTTGSALNPRTIDRSSVNGLTHLSTAAREAAQSGRQVQISRTLGGYNNANINGNGNNWLVNSAVGFDDDYDDDELVVGAAQRNHNENDNENTGNNDTDSNLIDLPFNALLKLSPSPAITATAISREAVHLSQHQPQIKLHMKLTSSPLRRRKRDGTNARTGQLSNNNNNNLIANDPQSSAQEVLARLAHLFGPARLSVPTNQHLINQMSHYGVTQPTLEQQQQAALRHPAIPLNQQRRPTGVNSLYQMPTGGNNGNNGPAATLSPQQQLMIQQLMSNAAAVAVNQQRQQQQQQQSLSPVTPATGNGNLNVAQHTRNVAAQAPHLTLNRVVPNRAPSVPLYHNNNNVGGATDSLSDFSPSDGPPAAAQQQYKPPEQHPHHPLTATQHQLIVTSERQHVQKPSPGGLPQMPSVTQQQQQQQYPYKMSGPQNQAPKSPSVITNTYIESNSNQQVEQSNQQVAPVLESSLSTASYLDLLASSQASNKTPSLASHQNNNNVVTTQSNSIGSPVGVPATAGSGSQPPATIEPTAVAPAVGESIGHTDWAPVGSLSSHSTGANATLSSVESSLAPPPPEIMTAGPPPASHYEFVVGQQMGSASSIIIQSTSDSTSTSTSANSTDSGNGNAASPLQPPPEVITDKPDSTLMEKNTHSIAVHTGDSMSSNEMFKTQPQRDHNEQNDAPKSNNDNNEPSIVSEDFQSDNRMMTNNKDNNNKQANDNSNSDVRPTPTVATTTIVWSPSAWSPPSSLLPATTTPVPVDSAGAPVVIAASSPSIPTQASSSHTSNKQQQNKNKKQDEPTVIYGKRAPAAAARGTATPTPTPTPTSLASEGRAATIESAVPGTGKPFIVPVAMDEVRPHASSANTMYRQQQQQQAAPSGGSQSSSHNGINSQSTAHRRGGGGSTAAASFGVHEPAPALINGTPAGGTDSEEPMFGVDSQPRPDQVAPSTEAAPNNSNNNNKPTSGAVGSVSRQNKNTTGTGGGVTQQQPMVRRPVFKPRPAQPVRIDTCDPEHRDSCESHLNEWCVTEFGISSCHCRPGYARQTIRGPCVPSVSYIVVLRAERLGTDDAINLLPHNSWKNQPQSGVAGMWHQAALTDTNSEEFQLAEYETLQALSSVFLGGGATAHTHNAPQQQHTSQLSGLYIGARINKFTLVEPSVRRTQQSSSAGNTYNMLINVTLQFEATNLTQSTTFRSLLQQELQRATRDTTRQLADGNVWLAPAPPVSVVQGGGGGHQQQQAISPVDDLNECASADLNDCAPEALCHNEFGSFRCACRAGYDDVHAHERTRAGRRCTGCSPAACSMRGTCSIEGARRTCKCRAPYFGAQCQMDAELIAVAVGGSLIAIAIVIVTFWCLYAFNRKWRHQAAMGAVIAHSGSTSGTSASPASGKQHAFDKSAAGRYALYGSSAAIVAPSGAHYNHSSASQIVEPSNHHQVYHSRNQQQHHFLTSSLEHSSSSCGDNSEQQFFSSPGEQQQQPLHHSLYMPTAHLLSAEPSVGGGCGAAASDVYLPRMLPVYGGHHNNGHQHAPQMLLTDHPQTSPGSSSSASARGALLHHHSHYHHHNGSLHHSQQQQLTAHRRARLQQQQQQQHEANTARSRGRRHATESTHNGPLYGSSTCWPMSDVQQQQQRVSAVHNDELVGGKSRYNLSSDMFARPPNNSLLCEPNDGAQLSVDPYAPSSNTVRSVHRRSDTNNNNYRATTSNGARQLPMNQQYDQSDFYSPAYHA
ncbi:hypothetical protein GZH46_02571, partial [Fragariocoptes setiger]